MLNHCMGELLLFDVVYLKHKQANEWGGGKVMRGLEHRSLG